MAAATGCLLRRGVAIRDVPSDGDCIFHAIGYKIQWLYKLGPDGGPPRPGHPGSAWRAYCVNYTVTTTDTLEGMTIPAWVEACTGLTLARYVTLMSHARDRDSWGGFLEAALIATAWGRGLVIVSLRACAEGYQVLAHAGSAPADTRYIAYICWTGGHWVRTRSTPEAATSVQHWRRAS